MTQLGPEVRQHLGYNQYQIVRETVRHWILAYMEGPVTDLSNSNVIIFAKTQIKV